MVLRAMFARLLPKCRIERHFDKHPSFAIGHRIHVPLVTNPDVEFIVGEERIPPRANYAFELNNMMPHSVSNNGSTVFYTGNWYAAHSNDSGGTWTYINPNTAFPADDNGFCCDQNTIYDPVNNSNTVSQRLMISSRTCSFFVGSFRC